MEPFQKLSAICWVEVVRSDPRDSKQTGDSSQIQAVEDDKHPDQVLMCMWMRTVVLQPTTAAAAHDYMSASKMASS